MSEPATLKCGVCWRDDSVLTEEVGVGWRCSLCDEVRSVDRLETREQAETRLRAVYDGEDLRIALQAAA